MRTHDHARHDHDRHDHGHADVAMLMHKLRHRGGFGGEGFGPGGPRGFGPGGPRGFGPGGPHGGRRRKRGEIREAILHLLADRPMHGYEMIQEIGERSGGTWTPSPGSVYPMLQLLEDEGLVTPEQRDGRKVFSLTKDGEAHVAEHVAEQTPPWQPAEGEADSPHHRMRSAIGKVMMAAQQAVHAGDAAQVEAAVAILEQTRRDLYGVLAGEPADD